jgi:gamma-glutamylcyclotransferase (GGCT)/AIG2-like uncharacterized protein YtfP
MSGTLYPVFVYGTLHPEHENYNQWLVEDELGIHEWHKATTKGTRLPAGYPWDLVWFGDSEDTFEGAILVLTTEQQLRRLDRYEGFRADDPEHSMFLRKQIEVTLDDGQVLQAWGYQWGRTKDEELPRVERFKENGYSLYAKA